jgi:hypothetical protein
VISAGPHFRERIVKEGGITYCGKQLLLVIVIGMPLRAVVKTIAGWSSWG